MIHERRVLLIMSAVAACLCPGCIVFFQKENVAAPDPQAHSFVYVEQMRGKTLMLRNGDSISLGALSLEGLSDYQQERLSKAIQDLAPYPDAAPQKSKACRGLLIRHNGDHEDVLLSLPYIDPRHFCGLRAVSLFPIRTKVPPKHIDILEYAFEGGLAKLNAQAVADPARRERYLKAQNHAKNTGLGVWASQGEQLLEAAEVGNISELERLLNLGAPINYVGQKYPTQANAEQVSHHRKLPLLHASAYRHEGRTALMVAITYWRLDAVQALLRRADVNMPVHDHKRTYVPAVRALHYAAHVHCPDTDKRMAMLKLLVEAGADVRAADAEQRLIRFEMFSSSQWDVIDYLHSRGASLEAFDTKKHRPNLLASAAAVGNAPDIKRLIAFGADVNGLTQLGTYPLSVAADAGNVPIARILLDAGADPNRKDSKSRSPMDHAKRRSKNSRMIELLAKSGAR